MNVFGNKSHLAFPYFDTSSIVPKVGTINIANASGFTVVVLELLQWVYSIWWQDVCQRKKKISELVYVYL